MVSRRVSTVRMSKMKTEHAGAKNGGGWWGHREEAKALSRVHRRLDDGAAVAEQLDELDVPEDFSA